MNYYFRKVLTAIDGVDRSFIIATILPPNKILDDVKKEEFCHAYMQFAGSRDRLIIELRRLVEAGGYEHVVIGRGGETAEEADLTEVVTWGDDGSLSVAPWELFAADEAAALLSDYAAHGDLTLPHVERPIDV
jgi:hypothetical protein